MKRNCCTNSVPYGYGGRIAETSVLPVRIIMSPTCSSRFLVGRKTRSAAALTTTEFLPRENYPRPPENTYANEAYAMRIGSARGNRSWRDEGGSCALMRLRVVCSPGFEGLEHCCCAVPSRDRRMRWRGAPGRERAGGKLPGRGRRRDLSRQPEARQELRPRGHRPQRRQQDHPEHRHDRERARPPQDGPGPRGRRPAGLRAERRAGGDSRLP